jgi:hypothetical protein
MEIDQVADRVAAAAEEVAGAGSSLGRHEPGAGAFGGGIPGRLGELGRDLHRTWGAALAAREREAAGHGARLTDLAGALRSAADGYRQVEDGARRRHGTVS